ncbi:hypothetical protein PFISCL1PPCAC_22853, partial [Pristionchus fissidentatus]
TTSSRAMTHHLTLEALPTESVRRILNNLRLNDRKTVRACSKTLREAVQQSDLPVERIELRFGEEQFKLVVYFYCNLVMERTDSQNHLETLQQWMSEKRER